MQSALEGQRKPDAQIFLTLLERLKLKPEEVVFLDDIGINVKAARNMGFQTIKVLSKYVDSLHVYCHCNLINVWLLGMHTCYSDQNLTFV